MTYVEKFLKLVQENPDARIIPLVDTDVIGDDSYTRWYGSFGDCYLDEMCEPEDMERAYFKSNIEQLEEDFSDRYDDTYITDDEYNTALMNYKNGLTWEKVIIVNIDCW